MKKDKLAIVGNGGFAREVAAWAKESYFQIEHYVTDEYAVEGLKSLECIDFERDEVIVAVADCGVRQKLVQELEKLSNNTVQFATLIHPTAIIGPNVEIGAGSIICAQCILTVDIFIGQQTQLNLQTTVGHGSWVGGYSTTAPKVAISGDVFIGIGTYLGTGAVVKEKLAVVSNTNVGIVIGANATVVKDITQPGIYIGTPAKPL